MAARLQVFDKYEVIRRLASGGMGDIFLARQTGAAGFNRLVVLKSLKPDVAEQPDFLAQFLNEARTAARLNHPNVVAVYDVGEYRGVYFLAMEYIRGADLAVLAKAMELAEQRLPQRLAAAIAHDAALGLFHAHRATDEAGQPLEIVHRDVSPQNLMVRLDGLTKVVDFGIAAAKDELGRREPGKVQGKLRYLAPEQLEGKKVDGRADQYALGVVLYELLTQSRPFTGRTPKEVFGQILSGGLVPPHTLDETISPELSAITMRMLRRRQEERFADLEAVAHALRPFRDDGPPVEGLLSRFATALVGRRVQALTQNLTPEPVEVAGLLQTADRPCPACGAVNAIRDRYCRACGAGLLTGSRPSPPSSQGTSGRSGSVDVTALGAELLRAAGRAKALTGGELRSVLVIAAELAPGSGADQVLPKVVEAWAEEQEVVLQFAGPGRTHFIFGAGPRPATPRGVVAAAFRLLELAKAQVGGVLAIAEGPAQLGGGAGRSRIAGPAPDQAERLLGLAQGLAGVFVSDALARQLERHTTQRAVRVATDGGLEVYLCQVLLKPEPEVRTWPLFGRRAELTTAEQVLNQGLGGRPETLVIAADPGLGKSRFLLELSRRAAERGAIVVQLSGQDRRPPGPELLAPAVEQALQALAADEALDDPLELLGLEPAPRRRLLLALGRRVPEWDPDSTEPRLRDDAALVRALIAIADLRPICLLVDDLHLFPPAAIGRFDELTRRLRGGRIAAFASVDRAELPVLGLTAKVQTLPPLGDDKILALAAAQLGGPLPAAAAHLLLERADGSPSIALLLAEMMFDLGGLARVDGHLLAQPSLTTLELPHRIEELVTLRLTRLDKRTRDFLRVGAVLGSPFEVPLVAKALGVAEPEALVQAAVTQRLLVRGGPGSVHFAQPQIRRTLVERLTAQDRQRVHARLAQVLAAEPRPLDPRRGDELVRHYLAADQPLEAVQVALQLELEAIPSGADALMALLADAIVASPALLEQLAPEERERLVDHALPRWAKRSLEEAERLATLLVPHLDPLPQRRLLAQRAELRRRLGRLAEALHDARSALSAAPSPSPSRVLATLAAVLEDRGELGPAAEQLEAAITAEAQAQSGDRGLPSALANALGRLHFKLQRPDEAAPLFELARATAREVQDPLREAQALINLAALAALGHDPGLAERHLQEAEGLAERGQDPLTLAKIAFNQGRLALSRGQPAAARDALERAARIARDVGWQEGEALALESLRPL